MKKIILASSSPRRHELLRLMGINFEVIPANIDETALELDTPELLVQSLAYKKAESVTRLITYHALVIGADTVVYKNKILGKPSSYNNALEMLKFLNGKWHKVITGVAIIDTETGNFKTFHSITSVKMKNFTDEEIISYISTGEPMDKAGSYGIQGKGAILVEKIKGCYYNVVGLPIADLHENLKYFGINCFDI